MKHQTRLLVAVLIMAVMACAPFGGGGGAGGGLPSPTPPPIPTKPALTPTSPGVATQPQSSSGPQIQPMAFVYGSARGAHLGIYLLGATGETYSGLDLKDVLNAVWPAPSPDGNKIAFVSEQSDLLINGIFIYNRSDGTVTQLTQGDGTHPQWSPDGSKIAYTCNTGGASIGLHTVNTDVCVINADGSGQVNLTSDNPRLDAYPHWTQDGRIVFMSSRDLPTTGLFSEVYIMNGDGSGVTALTSDKKALNSYPSVSPDGTKIAFESNRDVGVGSEIYIMNIDGTKPLRLTNDNVWNQNPVWSPDGNKILYAKAGADGNIDLYQVNTDGSNEFRLTHDGAEDGGLRLGHAWLPQPVTVESPDREDKPSVTVKLPQGSSAASNGILFAASSFNCSVCLETGIYFVSFDGANLTKLPLTGLYPAWSPDFTRIAVVQDGELVIANADSSNPTVVTHAHYNLSALQWNKDGSQILATCQPYVQFDTCLIDPKTSAINDITQNVTFDTGLANASYASADRILIGKTITDLLGVQVGSAIAPGRVSPDGAKFAFIESRQLSVGSFPDAGDAERITHDPTTKGFPIWSPDSLMVFYTAAPGDGGIYLWGIRADGVNGPKQLVGKPIVAGPTPRPTLLTTWLGYSWAP